MSWCPPSGAGAVTVAANPLRRDRPGESGRARSARARGGGNPDSSVVLYIYNGAASTKTFQIIDDSTQTGFTATMVPGELSTFVW